MTELPSIAETHGTTSFQRSYSQPQNIIPGFLNRDFKNRLLVKTYRNYKRDVSHYHVSTYLAASQCTDGQVLAVTLVFHSAVQFLL